MKRQPTYLIEKINEIKAQIKTKERALSELKKGQIDAINKELEEVYFAGLPFEGVNGYSDYGHIKFRMKRPEKDYTTEICSIVIKKSDYKLQSPDQLGLSYYSTSEVSDFEIDRLIILGKIAQIIKNHGDDILETINKIAQPYENTIKPLRRTIWKAQSEVDSLRGEINDVLKYKATRKLFVEGYEIPMDGKSGLETIYVRNDYRVNQIKSVKFLSWTNDNRISLTIRITRKTTVYDVDKQMYVDGESEVEIHRKVRINNVSHIISRVKEELRKELKMVEKDLEAA